MPDYGVYKLTIRDLRRYCVIALPAALLIGELFYRSVWVALFLLPLCVPARRLYENMLAEKRRAALAVSFRDLLYSLSSSFATGRQMPEALAEGLEALRLIYPDDAPMVAELADMKKRLYESREDEAAILRDFARRSRDEDIRNFTDAYLTCRAVGGDAERLVARAADGIMDKMSFRREIMALTAQKRLESKVLLAIPAVILLALRVFSPDYTAALYETAAGRLIMTVALGVTLCAYVWSLKLTRIDF